MLNEKGFIILLVMFVFLLFSSTYAFAGVKLNGKCYESIQSLSMDDQNCNHMLIDAGVIYQLACLPINSTSYTYRVSSFPPTLTPVTTHYTSNITPPSCDYDSVQPVFESSFTALVGALGVVLSLCLGFIFGALIA